MRQFSLFFRSLTPSGCYPSYQSFQFVSVQASHPPPLPGPKFAQHAQQFSSKSFHRFLIFPPAYATRTLVFYPRTFPPSYVFCRLLPERGVRKYMEWKYGMQIFSGKNPPNAKMHPFDNISGPKTAQILKRERPPSARNKGTQNYAHDPSYNVSRKI